MNFRVEHYRIILSRIAAVIALFFLVSTQSYWEGRSIAVTSSLFFIGIVFVGIASLGRMWCSLYIAGYKDNRLVKEGPYSLCRNPLYFFSMIGVVGIGCATETFSFPIFFIVLFSLYYPFVIRSEERRLKKLFGIEFEEYAKRIPPFFPKFSAFFEPEKYLVKPAKYRYHIYSAIWFVWFVGILEIIRGLKAIGLFASLWALY